MILFRSSNPSSNTVSWLITIIIVLATATAFVASIAYGQVYSTVTKQASFERFLKTADASDRLALSTTLSDWVEEAAAAKEKDDEKEAAAKQTAETVKVASSDQAAQLDSTTCNSSTTHNNPASIDVIVNKKHCIQPLTFAPTDLVTSNGATLKSEASAAFNSLLADSTAAGFSIYATSSYRSYESQVSTYNYWVGVSGKDGADTYSARPGYSEHQTGLAVDVATPGCVLDCFKTTSAYQWMIDHAAEYGFIQRYYSGYEDITGYIAEEWHYRYVGAETAQDMRSKGIKTLEQYWEMPGGDY
jgi:D-alanyl-D-alanine carboxypeptidase